MSLEKFDQVELAPKPSRRRLWLLLGLIVILLLGIGVTNILRSDAAQYLLGNGTVTGVVVDPSGKPLDAEIFVEQTSLASRTNADGVFELRGLPGGARMIVVARNGGGMEFNVIVSSGGTVDMGRLQFIGTPVPGK
jgi:hypothetical protein